MSKMFMNVKEVMEVLEVSESYAYKLMKKMCIRDRYSSNEVSLSGSTKSAT